MLRFIQEARLLSRLNHPHIVGIRGLGRFPGGGFFLAMELVDGSDLQKRLGSGRLSADEVLRIAKAVASAMAYIHDAGIVHSDLKPANVLLAKTGGVYFSDFGFACLLAGDHSAHGIGGTAGYIAPEVKAGETPPTIAADVYSFGALLASIVSGQEQHDVSIAIKQLADRCMATRPSERFASFGDAIAALESL